ncbi:hypothetical protein V490_07157, partial [Pseudogymnoascus sp. VKM F-3557]
ERRDRDTDEFELLHRGDQGYADGDVRDNGPVSPVHQHARGVEGEETGYEAYRPQGMGVAR